ncbi:class II glutamine amidotransferase [Niveibacterium terrae]|uniref:class II glutamine amidotransferase n=1 Tax=Niveibacterium terrae TaxID=3373598 RepID=UPI003A956F66
MCQLLGMNSLRPAELGAPLERFLRRGGETDEHADGWGIAYFADGDCRLLLDEQASARSRLARWVLRERLRSCNVVAHIRKATQGQVEAFNCHPFVRELWGRRWAFAHNGNLDLAGMSPRFFRPVGGTDSEQAFCLLLDSLFARFGPRQPEAQALSEALREIAARIAERGTFNFLLADGRTLFAHCSTRLHWVQREAGERGALIATEPLSGEAWAALAPGELIGFADGCRLA